MMTEYQQAMKALSNAYLEILRTTDIPEIYRDTSLSGIFLASPDPSYFESKYKVIVIGQEPKTWRRNCTLKSGKPPTSDIILDAMSDSLKVCTQSPGRHRFLKFYQRCSQELSDSSQDFKHSAVWANQLCVSQSKRNPLKSQSLPHIKELSAKLLQAQFELLKPDIAVFTTAHYRDELITSTFDTHTNEGGKHKYLWQFTIGNTQCFRINHPSARRRKNGPDYSHYQALMFERAYLT